MNRNIHSIIAAAGNFASGDNPEYTVDKFLAQHPKFEEMGSEMISAWIKIANASLPSKRWGEYWEMGMGLFIAHHLTISYQTMQSDKIGDSLAHGVISSKSVSDMSISYDYGSIASEFIGWGTYAQTPYGQQLVQLARLIGRGGMTVW